MHFKRVFRVLAALCLCLAAFTAQVEAQNWTLVWSDEFNQPDGSSPDTNKWVFETGGGGWGNSELESYTSRTNNCRIVGGQLIIEAHKENYTGSDGIARNYTSARIKTQTKAMWTYGRMEASIQIPRGQGLWPAYWMLGQNIGPVGWPTCGEVDIMENIGAEPSTVHGTLHGPGYSGGNGIGSPYALSGGAAFADAFHVFAVEWAPNLMRWFVDGHLYFTVTPSNIPSGSTWVFSQPQFMLLNVAVGGNWPGSPTTNTVFPQRMTVEYVRVYAATSTNCSLNALPNPGFELGGLANWSSFGGGANVSVQNSTNLPVHGGTNVLKLYGQFSGSDNLSGASRDVLIAPGASLVAGGYAITTSGDKIAGNNTGYLEVSFRDAATNVLSLYRSAFITSNSTAGVWYSLPVTNQLNPVTSAVIGTVTNLLAPAGTVLTRFRVVFHQPQTAAGSVLFDDLSLAPDNAGDGSIPLSSGQIGGNFSLSFPTLAGQSYQVLWKDDFSVPAWSVLTNLTGNGGPATIYDPLAQANRLYSVLRVCK